MTRAHIRDPFLRRLLDAPEPAPETPEEAAARRADLAARLDADIAETERRLSRAATGGGKFAARFSPRATAAARSGSCDSPSRVREHRAHDTIFRSSYFGSASV